MASPLQLSIVTFQKNSYIIVEGKEKADYFYIVRSGQVRVSKEVEIVEEEGGNILEPGDFFGVVATMSSHSHIETAMAITDVSLIAVHREQFGLLIERNTPVAIKIIMEFSRRMRYLDEALTKLTLQNTGVEDPSHLFAVAEYYARQNQYNQAFYAYYRYLQHCPDGENISLAEERLEKIKPYASAVYLDSENDFNRNYPKNTMIFSEAEPGHDLYIIQRGNVKITKIVDDKEIMIALLKPGDIFGEMALLENKPRVASAIAHESGCQVMVVSRANFEQMVASQAQLITKLTTVLAERIWFAYKQLANTVMEDPSGKLYDQLYIQMERLRIPIKAQGQYTFDFGPKELINMVGLSGPEGNQLVAQLLKNSKLKLVENKIQCTDIEEVKKQSEYFKKMEKIKKARRRGSLRA